MAKDSGDRVTMMPLTEDQWIGYEPDSDGRYQRIDADPIEIEDPEDAARRFVAAGYASGTHRIMVVNLNGAREFDVTVEATEVVASDAS